VFGGFAATQTRQTLCVLNLAKIFFINKKSFLNVGGGKIFKW
jgi:hypothetical protein